MLFCQEKEAAESNDEWYSTTLRRIREASPLSLKVTLQSVSLHFPCMFIYFPLKVLAVCINLFYLIQIREGRFETLDKCLIREYRMSLRGISKLVSSDFFEVMIFLDAFSKTTLFFFLLLYLTDSLCRVFEHEWLIKILHQRYVYFVP